FEVGTVRFDFAKRCGRCLVTTTDQKTGIRHSGEEPLRTLVRDRLFDKSACFGSYYLPQAVGELAVGDTICTG
ncbi:MAG: MOSC domain-containing protein, partial [Verrucomicrobiaceae bacterium]